MFKRISNFRLVEISMTDQVKR